MIVLLFVVFGLGLMVLIDIKLSNINTTLKNIANAIREKNK